MNILLLETKKKYSVLMKEVLGRYGDVFFVQSFSACMEAIVQASETGNYFKWMIIDLDLPEGSSLKILKTVRMMEQEQKIPSTEVFLMTENLSMGKVLNFFSVDHDRFLYKTTDENVFATYFSSFNCIQRR